VCESRSELRRVPWRSHEIQFEELGRKPKRVIDRCFEALIGEINPYFGQLRSDGKTAGTICYGLPRLAERLYLAHEIERQIPALHSIVDKGKRLENGVIFDGDVDVEGTIGEKYFDKPSQPAPIKISRGLLGFLGFFMEQVVSKISSPVVFEIDRSGCQVD
jgi:hypothetical protein